MPTGSWLTRARPLLGKVSDHEINRRLGIPRRTVSQARRKLGIAPAPRIGRAPRIDTVFLARATPLFGRVSDNEIARRLKVDVRRVAAARRDAGFEPFGKHPTVTIANARPLTVAMLRSQRSAPEIARLTGINAQTIRGRRAALRIPTPKRPTPAWVAMAKPMLGKLADPEVARRVRASSASVWAVRRRLGIAPAPIASRALATALTPAPGANDRTRPLPRRPRRVRGPLHHAAAALLC